MVAELTRPIDRLEALPIPYQNSVIHDMLLEQRQKGWPARVALISDYDNSYYGVSSPDTIKFTHSVADISASHAIPNIIVTGNSSTLQEQKIETAKIRKPSIISGAYGTDIKVLQRDGTYTVDTAFDAHLATITRNVGYDRLDVAKKGYALTEEGGGTSALLKKARLQLQDQFKENELKFIHGDESAVIEPYKFAFYFFADTPEERMAVEDEIAKTYPDFTLVGVEEIHHNKSLAPGEGPKKYCLDIMPFPPKAEAVRYLTNLLGINEGLRVGDSENDSFFLSEIPVGAGVVVNKAVPELLPRMLDEQSEDIPRGKFYRGHSGRGRGNIFYVASPTDHPAAGSILAAADRRLRLFMLNRENAPYMPEMQQMLEEIRTALA